MASSYQQFEKQIRDFSQKAVQPKDIAHDELHTLRVVTTARRLALAENADLDVVIPAAWLHDCVWIAKDDPRRSIASRLSATAAGEFLKSLNFPREKISAIEHAIAAHSFSAAIQCETLEAKVVQDADRLDGLGAVGVSRCFATAGMLARKFYESSDPFCVTRQPEDKVFTIDHFYQKLFRTAETLQTLSGQKEGRRRADFMRLFLNVMQHEVASPEVPDYKKATI